MEAHEVGRSPSGARVWKLLGRGRPGARAGGLKHLWRPAGQPSVDLALHESWFYWEGGESPQRRPTECFQRVTFISALRVRNKGLWPFLSDFCCFSGRIRIDMPY